MKPILRSRFALLAGILTGLLGVILTVLPIGRTLEEDVGLDLLFKLRGIRPPPSEVAIVTLDKNSADIMNLPTNPDRWPRRYYADLIARLNELGAQVLVFNMDFDENRPDADDSLFAKAMQQHRNVILTQYLSREKMVIKDEKGRAKNYIEIEKTRPAVQVLAESAIAIAPFPLPKFPVKVNRYWLFKPGAGDIPTLPVVVFQVYALSAYEQLITNLCDAVPHLSLNFTRSPQELIQNHAIEQHIRRLKYVFLNEVIPDSFFHRLEQTGMSALEDKQKQLLKALVSMYTSERSHYLNLYGPPGTIPTYPFQVFFDPEVSTINPAIDLRGKVIFIGVAGLTWMEQQKGFPTVFTSEHGLDLSSVELAASAFANLLENLPIQPFSFQKQLAIVFLWGIAVGILCFSLTTIWAALILFVLSAVYFCITFYQFSQNGTWLPFVILILLQGPAAYFGTLLCKYFQAKKEGKNIRKAFGYYLPNHVVDELSKDLSSPSSNGQLVFGTCLMTDAAFYTALAESLEPKELAVFMNNYFKQLFMPIRQHHGVVSDVVGDSMLAIWTTAKPDIEQRKHACLAALEIADLHTRLATSTGVKKLDTRIGLHSGEMMIGNIGAMDHFEYTPIGDIVNTASRIEGLNKYLGTKLLVTADVLEGLDGFAKRRLGRFLLVGKTKPVEVFELLGTDDHASEPIRNMVGEFEAALQLFELKDWTGAKQKFNSILSREEKDGPSRYFVICCKKYENQPPAPDWDGVIRFDRK